jgi:hypothetical protein
MALEAATAAAQAGLKPILAACEAGPLSHDGAAALARHLSTSRLLAAGPDGLTGGLWAPVTALQTELIGKLLKLVAKGEVRGTGQEP